MALLNLFQMFGLFYFSLLICSAYSSNYVPIIMWGTEKSDSPMPALNHIQKDEFKDIISDKLQNPNTCLLVFAEESLSPEDFTAYDDKQKNIFSKISNLRKKWQTNYYPYVDSPIEVLKNCNKKVKEISHDQIKNLKVQPGQIIIVDLNDAKEVEDRDEMLMRHDGIMYAVFKKVSAEHKDVVALYTGRHSSWLVATEEADQENVRQRRHLLAQDESEPPKGTNHLYTSEHAFFYFTNSATVKYASDEYPLTNCTVDPGTRENNSILFQFCGANDTKVTFNMTQYETGYWFLHTITIVVENTSHGLGTNINAPIGFSYHCVEFNVTNPNETISISLPGLQMEPFFNKKDNVTRFSSAYDCVGFTSGPIWSGIFVTFILALIMTFGLCMIMDIKTMDRFDDPKGKTISINVSE